MDNVIDASNRFVGSREDKPKVTPLDKLRQSARTERDDAILLASRLGQIAQKLSSKQPNAVARRWFNELWGGERWEKRKRYILLDGEAAPDPIASNGADWAALIERAATSLHPDDSATSIKERARICRDVLRGTSYLPALGAGPILSDSAQLLLVALTTKICDSIDAKTGMVRLWEALEQTPFDLQSYHFSQPIYGAEYANDPVNAVFISTDRYNGDTYSQGPLGEAARGAEQIAHFRYRQDHESSYRFEPRKGYGHADWQYPILLLGLVGYRRESRIFVIPHNFVDELPFDQEFDDEEKSLEDRVVEWLVMKEVVPDKDDAKLPELKHSPELGFGWKPFTFDVPRRVWVEVRPRADGSPGLWLSSHAPDWVYTYPVLPGMDTLSIEANCGNQSWFRFLPMSVDRSLYEFLHWPTCHPEFLVGSTLPEGAVSGLLDPNYHDMSDVEGWLDDLENAELQDFLFRLPTTARFYPSISLDDEVPPPCPIGTVAAAIFANAGSAPEDRIAMQFMRQSEVIAMAGLAFHAAFLASHRARIEAMIPD